MKIASALLVFAALALPFWSVSGQTAPKNPAPQGQAHKDTGSEEVKIEIQKAPVREKPLFYAPLVGELKEGDAVKVATTSGVWMKIKSVGGLEGWIHSSSVAKKERVKFRIGQASPDDAPANAEAYAATKGFNEDMEKDYKKDKDMEKLFQQVDWIEKNPALKKDARQLDAELREFRQKSKIGEFHDQRN